MPFRSGTSNSVSRLRDEDRPEGSTGHVVAAFAAANRECSAPFIGRRTRAEAVADALLGPAEAGHQDHDVDRESDSGPARLRLAAGDQVIDCGGDDVRREKKERDRDDEDAQ